MCAPIGPVYPKGDGCLVPTWLTPRPGVCYYRNNNLGGERFIWAQFGGFILELLTVTLGEAVPRLGADKKGSSQGWAPYFLPGHPVT